MTAEQAERSEAGATDAIAPAVFETSPQAREDAPQTALAVAEGAIAQTGRLSVPELPENVVNAPIEWDQLLGGWLSDFTDPAVVLAFLGVIVTWLSGSGPVTLRLGLTAVIGGLIAAEQVILRMSNNDGLARRLRARGQINGGR